MIDKIENDENQNLIDDHEEATAGMNEIDNFDFERAVMLMGVMEKVSNVAPKSSAIMGLASAALEEMNQEAKDIAKRRAEAFKELERQRDEALAAQRADQEARKLSIDEEEARLKAERVEAQRAKAIPNPQTEVDPNPPRTQSLGTPPSKTDAVARDNSRRL